MNRGDVFELKLDRDSRGHEQGGKRFGVVVQSHQLMALSTVVLAPTSTRALATDFRPQVIIRRQRTRVLCEQVRALDVRRLGKRVGRLRPDELEAVDAGLRLAIGLGH